MTSHQTPLVVFDHITRTFHKIASPQIVWKPPPDPKEQKDG